MGELSPYLHELAVQAATHFGQHTQTSITFTYQGAVVRAASSDEPAARCDQVEARTGTGPCVQAMDQLHAVLVPRIPDDGDAWAQWRDQALAEGFVSAVAMPAHVRPGVAVTLNLYSGEPDPWDAQALLDADAHVQAVAVALRARLTEPVPTLDREVRRALDARALLDHAVGVLMHANASTPQEVSEVLSRMSIEGDLSLEQAAVLVLRSLEPSADVDALPTPNRPSD
ncbi:GAF and ANTAR domain-containing protein [Cellulomonas cellasea]|uniref:Transcriptional regulator n=1 Tax=Cellulomonas cellasea TaxID=43670 RepID=A0A4Y3KNX2_9CELL|nr:GAF and ANTAR domain-containing protein [Cellulomonas cellasea]GEA86119.1 transcriptional regulator [Cellulomonas cellasea]